jgi:hypothetical protein
MKELFDRQSAYQWMWDELTEDHGGEGIYWDGGEINHTKLAEAYVFALERATAAGGNRSIDWLDDAEHEIWDVARVAATAFQDTVDKEV